MIPSEIWIRCALNNINATVNLPLRGLPSPVQSQKSESVSAGLESELDEVGLGLES